VIPVFHFVRLHILGVILSLLVDESTLLSLTSQVGTETVAVISLCD
jgi:hypothetical protein